MGTYFSTPACGKEHNLSVGPITGLWSWLTRLLRANTLLFSQHSTCYLYIITLPHPSLAGTSHSSPDHFQTQIAS